MNIDHLSDWRIEELLIARLEARGGIQDQGGSGDGSHDQALLHLEDCALCRAKKEHLETALLLYREAAYIKTAEAAASNCTSVRKTQSFVVRHTFWGWPARACALLLLPTVLIPAFVGRERERHQAQQVARNQLIQEQAKQEQAEDDLLLRQVDQEITESVPQPMQSLAQPVLDEDARSNTHSFHKQPM